MFEQEDAPTIANFPVGFAEPRKFAGEPEK
jgi:hypothetical protein